jgi:lysine-N-methylase
MNLVGEVLQRSLDLSCPEAARVILLNPGPIEFQASKFNHGSIRDGAFPTLDDGCLRDFPGPHSFSDGLFNTVQPCVISLLQNRSRPIWKRLYILGSFCDKLNEALAHHSGQDALNVIQELAADLNSGVLDDHFDRYAVNPTAQMEGALDLIAPGISPNYNPRRFLECYREFIGGIQWTSQSTIDELGTRFAEVHAQYYDSFMNRHQHILEHYLVNYAYKTLFPIGLPETNRRRQNDRVSSPIAAQYMMMIVHYAVTRAMLIGMAGFHQSAFGLDHVLKTIQSCTKVFEHSVAYPARAIGILADKAMTTPASLCVLIQD